VADLAPIRWPTVFLVQTELRGPYGPERP